MKSRNHVTLSCFSPEVMIATFIIEAGLAIYVAWRYTLRAPERIAIILLACLASFQLAEYSICTGNPTYILNWTKFGLAAICLLPALGLHLASLITKQTRAVAAAYLSAAAIISTFLFIPDATSGAFCTGNYVIIHTNDITGIAFSGYYFIFLLVLLVNVFRATKNGATKLTKNSKYALYWLAGGYLSFIVPMIIAYAADPKLVHGTPSIMCGFALIFACILAVEVMGRFQLIPDKKLHRFSLQKKAGILAKN